MDASLHAIDQLGILLGQMLFDAFVQLGSCQVASDELVVIVCALEWIAIFSTSNADTFGHPRRLIDPIERVDISRYSSLV